MLPFFNQSRLALSLLFLPGTTVEKGRNQCGQLSLTCSTGQMASSRTWQAGTFNLVLFVELIFYNHKQGCGKDGLLVPWADARQRLAVRIVWYNILLNEDSISVMCTYMLGKVHIHDQTIRYYLTWLKDQLRMTGNEYVQSVARCESQFAFLSIETLTVRCLQMMLRIDNYRQVLSLFSFSKGLPTNFSN